jgi:mannose-1-phosphate guanylyltransferase
MVGRGAYVGAASSLERAVVGDGANIGHRVRVVDSIIGPGAVVGDDAVLLDQTVIGAGARVEPGTKLERRRVESLTTAE